MLTCSADPLTELVVIVNSDMAVPDEFNGFRVVVTGHDGDVSTDRFYFLGDEPGKVRLPADFGVIPKDGDASRRVNVEVWATESGADLFSTRAITGFVEGKTLRLDMFLARRCLTEAEACKPNETCRIQGCVPTEIDPADLPEFDPNAPPPASGDWLHSSKSEGSIWWETAFDAAGNVYAAGIHTSEVLIDGVVHETTGTSAMLASFDPTGGVRWFKSLSGNKLAWASSVATGGDGRVCFTGWFDGEMRLDTEVLVAASSQDGFVACFHEDGGLLWVKSFGASGNEQSKSVAVAPNGDVGIGGLYFNSMSLGGDPLPSPRLDDVFIARFDSSGNHINSRGFGGADLDDVAWIVAFDSQSNMIVGGTVSSGTVDFGGTERTYSGKKNGFVAKYLPDGSLVWVRSFENGGEQTLTGVDVGPDDRVAVAGGFPGVVDFGGGSLSSLGDLDAGVFVLDANGEHIASTLFGGPGVDRARRVRFSGDRILVSGLHTGEMSFGAASLLGAPDQNGFVLSLSPDLSSVHWAHTLGGEGNDIAQAVDVYFSDVIVVGEFASTIGFGPLWATSAGFRDSFLLYFRP